MSFWKQSPGPHWSDAIGALLSCPGTPLAQPIRRDPGPEPISSVYTVLRATEKDAERIVDFLEAHFKVTEYTKCRLPVSRLVQAIKKDWFVLYVEKNGKIIGTVACRPLGQLIFRLRKDKEIKISKYSSAGYIDFFCVHPDHQKGGLGSLLLQTIDWTASTHGRPIQFFQKEITPLLKLPPIWKGTYITREIIERNQNQKIRVSPFLKTSKQDGVFNICFHTQEPSFDTKYYTLDSGDYSVSLAITNLYHSFKGGSIGEVLFYTVDAQWKSVARKNLAAMIEEILSCSGYRYILMDETVPHLKQMPWKKDAPYYLYAYNVNPRHFFNVRPAFWF